MVWFGSSAFEIWSHLATGLLTLIGKYPSPDRSLSTHQPDHLLDPLPSISRLSDNVVRVLGQNPGNFTLQGTNTYIIGTQQPYTLVDTSDGREEYMTVLEAALRNSVKSKTSTESIISDIIISHWHNDHVGGLPSVLFLLRALWEERNPSTPFKPPRLYKFPLGKEGPAKSHQTLYTLPCIIEFLPTDLYTPTPDGHVFHYLHDKQILPSGLRVIHTPGHTSDSFSLYIPEDKALYTSDTVLGEGTSMFEDLSAYLKSLDALLHFGDMDPDRGYVALYPGHGAVIPDGRGRISEYIRHRLKREEEILEILRKPPPVTDPPAKYWTTWAIVKTLYASYPRSLWRAAAYVTTSHLNKLEDDGIIRRVSGTGEHTSWKLVEGLSPSFS